MKKKITLIALVSFIILGAYFLLGGNDQPNQGDQEVLAMTLRLSREYTALRYETDNVLLNARDFDSFEAWNTKVNQITERWQNLDESSQELLAMAEDMTSTPVGMQFNNVAYAYDKQEISDIFDRAPAGKKIATLAKHLGVDAKLAFAILKQDQAQVEADAWNKAGDTFQTLETSATLIKDGCKVTTFVGTIALTGGTAAIAAGSTLGKAAVIVAGADLALEVTDDASKIALGNNNKVSNIIGDARIVTEPAAAILMISTLPTNLTHTLEKLGAVTFGAEQLSSTIQEGKVIGIKLPKPSTKPGEQKMEVSVIDSNELNEWLVNETNSTEELTQEDIEELLNINEPSAPSESAPATEETEITPSVESSTNSANESESTSNEYLVGSWKGTLRFTPNSEASEQTTDFTLDIKPNGALGGEAAETYTTWTLVDGNLLRLKPPADEWEGYDEFRLSGNSLTYVKRAGINSEGIWQEDFAGSDFFGGKFMEIYLEKE